MSPRHDPSKTTHHSKSLWNFVRRTAVRSRAVGIFSGATLTLCSSTACDRLTRQAEPKKEEGSPTEPLMARAKVDLKVLGLELQRTEEEVVQILEQQRPRFEEVGRSWKVFNRDTQELVEAQEGTKGAYLASVTYERQGAAEKPRDTDRVIVRFAAPPAEPRVITIDRQIRYATSPPPWDTFWNELEKRHGKEVDRLGETSMERDIAMWAHERPPRHCLDLSYGAITDGGEALEAPPVLDDCTPNLTISIDHQGDVVHFVRAISNNPSVTIANEQKHEAHRMASQKVPTVP